MEDGGEGTSLRGTRGRGGWWGEKGQMSLLFSLGCAWGGGKVGYPCSSGGKVGCPSYSSRRKGRMSLLFLPNSVRFTQLNSFAMARPLRHGC